MSIKIKRNRYYKEYYSNSKEDYDILYTGTKWVYIIAQQFDNEPLYKRDSKHRWCSISEWQKHINMYKNRYNIKEISKEDLFLELL